MAVIYRIRNKSTGKCYIGESMEKDPYTRWRQHLANTRRGVGCPALRDAIKKYGEEAFDFQILFFCFDEDRFHYEIEAIKKYDTMVPNGYNIARGGQGGGAFRGKKHKPETLVKIQEKLRVYYDDPEWLRKKSENTKNTYKCPEARKKLSDSMKQSEKFKKAVEEGRVGGASHDYTPELRKKISESVKKYFATNKPNAVNIQNHRNAMAKAVGVKVYQYNLDGTYVRSFDSIKEAARHINKAYGVVWQALDKSNRTGGGYIWKRSGPNVIEHI